MLEETNPLAYAFILKNDLPPPYLGSDDEAPPPYGAVVPDDVNVVINEEAIQSNQRNGFCGRNHNNAPLAPRIIAWIDVVSAIDIIKSNK